MPTQIGVSILVQTIVVKPTLLNVRIYEIVTIESMVKQIYPHESLLKSFNQGLVIIEGQSYF
jgi:hypothetical protein